MTEKLKYCIFSKQQLQNYGATKYVLKDENGNETNKTVVVTAIYDEWQQMEGIPDKRFVCFNNRIGRSLGSPVPDEYPIHLMED